MAPQPGRRVMLDPPHGIVHQDAAPAVFHGKPGRRLHVEPGHAVIGVLAQRKNKRQLSATHLVVGAAHVRQRPGLQHEVVHFATLHAVALVDQGKTMVARIAMQEDRVELVYCDVVSDRKTKNFLVNTCCVLGVGSFPVPWVKVET